MYNNGRQRRRKQAWSTRRYTYRHVVGNDMKAEIQEAVEELSGALPGTREYFSKYQEGLKIICDRLPPDVIEQYKLAAKSWNEEKPPAEVQQQ
jgi:hypothetical protein